MNSHQKLFEIRKTFTIPGVEMDRIMVSFLTPAEVLMDHRLHRLLPLPVWLACDVDSPKDQLLAPFQK